MPREYTSNPIERFWARVQKTDTCWLWRGTKFEGGYGRLWANNQDGVAHRYSYELHYGPIPDGLFVCHHCDVKACVRPDHLFLGTPLDNMRDRDEKGRQASGARNGSRVWPERLMRGERVAIAKLTSNDVRDIRARYTNRRGMLAKLARDYGVDSSTIADIVRGKTWRHVV